MVIKNLNILSKVVFCFWLVSCAPNENSEKNNFAIKKHNNDPQITDTFDINNYDVIDSCMGFNFLTQKSNNANHLKCFGCYMNEYNDSIIATKIDNDVILYKWVTKSQSKIYKGWDKIYKPSLLSDEDANINFEIFIKEPLVVLVFKRNLQMYDILFTDECLNPYAYTQYREPSNMNQINIDFLSVIRDSCIYIIDTIPIKDVSINYESLMAIDKKIKKKLYSEPIKQLKCNIVNQTVPWIRFAWEKIPIYKY
jgi:hypothetical protein